MTYKIRIKTESVTGTQIALSAFVSDLSKHAAQYFADAAKQVFMPSYRYVHYFAFSQEGVPLPCPICHTQPRMEVLQTTIYYDYTYDDGKFETFIACCGLKVKIQGDEVTPALIKAWNLAVKLHGMNLAQAIDHLTRITT